VSLEMLPPFAIDKLPAATATVPAPALSAPACEVMPVKAEAFAPLIESNPATVTDTLPPLPRPELSDVIWPLLRIDRLPADTVTVPALPLVPRSAADAMPVADDEFDPSIVNVPVTATDTAPALPDPNVPLMISLPLLIESPPPTLTAIVPAFPGPAVVLDIKPAFDIASDPAWTTTVPAWPVLPWLACDAMPVAKGAFDPSIVNAPATVTDTNPALPGPAVPLEIWPPAIERLPAWIVIVPALPVLPGSLCADMPVRDAERPPTMLSKPSVDTTTSPPRPAPKVLLDISQVLLMAIVPA
jgi:hypothetical protein